MTEVSAGKLWGLRRLADEGAVFRILAVDREVAASLVRHLAPHMSAVMMDPQHSYPEAIHLADPTRGLIVTLEDVEYTETPAGRRSAVMADWSVEKAKRAGADAVKALAWYRPDAGDDVLRHQQDFVAAIGAECVRWDLPFVLELPGYSFPEDPSHSPSYVEHTARRAEMVTDSVATLAHPRYHVDLFELESPVPPGRVPDPDTGDAGALGTTQELFDALGAAAGRPWVMRPAGSSSAEYRRILTFAYRAGASGYVADEAVWGDADLEVGSVPSLAGLNRLTADLAVPWLRHERFGGGPTLKGAGSDFARGYLGVW